MADYFTILTVAGKAKIAAASAGGAPLALAQIVVGDGGGAPAQPSEAQAALVREVWRGAINALGNPVDNPSWIVVEALIPATVGGWTIREIGLVDVAGDLVAVANCPDSYKPTLAQGSAKDFHFKFILEVANAAAVTLKIDPAVVLAPRSWVTEQINLVVGQVNTHAAQTSVHGATPEAAPSRLLIRDAAGRAQVAAPSAAADIARKQDVDNAKSYADGQVDGHEAEANPHPQYATDADLAGHSQDGGAHGATSAATPNATMRRDAAGRTKAAAPAAADDVARKAEVDAVAGSLSTHAAAADPHGQYLLAAGDVMTGPLGVGASPLNGLDVISVGDPARGAVRVSYSALCDAVMACGYDAALGDDAYIVDRVDHATLANNKVRLLTIPRSGADAYLGPSRNLLWHAGRAGASLAASGYQRLPSGLILQWGSAASPGTETTVPVVFPVAFTSAVFGVLASTNVDSSVPEANLGTVNWMAQTYQLTLTGCKLFPQFLYNSTYTAITMYWIALGV